MSERRHERSRGEIAIQLWAGAALLGMFAIGVGYALSGDLSLDGAGLLLIGVLYAGLAWLIAVRQPGNGISWILMMPATWVVFEGVTTNRFGDAEPTATSGWDVLAIIWLNTGWWFALIIPLFLLLHLFPTGHFLTRRWSWAGWLAGLLAGIVVVVEAFAEEVGPQGANQHWTIANPIGVLEFSGLEEAGVLAFVFGLGLISLLVGGIVAIVVRYRRSSAAGRSQIKWVVFALTLAAIDLMSLILFEAWEGFFSLLMFVIGLVLVPIAIAIAITRYRLFEIDRIISRTLSYTLVVVLLGLLFAAGVVWIPTAFGLEDSPLLVAASTLAVAGLFNPLRLRVQRAVDKRFNRSRYLAERVNEEFGSHLRESLTDHQLAEIWIDTVETHFEPSVSAVWINDG